MKLTRVITLKMSGEDVKFLQSKLKEYGFFNNKIDGYFGQNTLMSVVNFQKSVGIKADGVVGLQTWSQIIHFHANKNRSQIVAEKVEVKETASFVGIDGLKIYDNLLTDEEYYKEEISKNTLWLHHTAGGSRPDWTIGGWEKDFQKDENGNAELDSFGKQIPVRVGTQYVIGRRSSSSDDKSWDGKILRAFDDKYWAYHLGISRNSRMLNSRSIGIEICNYGPLTLNNNGVFFNYVNRPIRENEVIELETPFRGYKYWEKYTDLQLENLRKLILHLSSKWGIQYDKGIYDLNWFEYNERWFTTGGLRTHTQVRRDKFDLFPQPELIQVLNSL
jgi:peptidoglycan hydrolase-like protein with peptidoglycan-binding domain